MISVPSPIEMQKRMTQVLTVRVYVKVASGTSPRREA